MPTTASRRESTTTRHSRSTNAGRDADAYCRSDAAAQSGTRTSEREGIDSSVAYTFTATACALAVVRALPLYVSCNGAGLPLHVCLWTLFVCEDARDVSRGWTERRAHLM